MKFTFLRTLYLTAILFVLAAQAADDSFDSDTLAYAKSLNTAATFVMNWYGRHIDDERYFIKPLYRQELNRESQYPDSIIGISLDNAALKTTENSLIFSVKGNLQYDKNGEIYQRPLDESIQFKGLIPNDIQSLITSPNTDVVGVTDGHQLNNKGYYQTRGFAYAWLAYLNGVEQAGSWIDLDDWKTTVNYQIDAAGFQVNGNISAVLPKHQQQLGKGRYLLREMKVNRSDKNDPNRGVMILAIDFSGEENGIPTVANIEQTIEYIVQADGSWRIIRIVEKHLLPNPQPWQKILC